MRYLRSFRIKFVFSFSRLDATIDDGSLGRLVNDEDNKPNAVVKVLEVDECPHICFFAAEVLEPGVEIRYNYGKGVDYPWRNNGAQTPLEDEKIASTTTVNLTKEDGDKSGAPMSTSAHNSNLWETKIIEDEMSPTSGQRQIEENHSTNKASEDFLDIEIIDNSLDSTDSIEIPFPKLTQSMKLTVIEECNHSIVETSVQKSNVNVDGSLKKHLTKEDGDTSETPINTSAHNSNLWETKLIEDEIDPTSGQR